MIKVKHGKPRLKGYGLELVAELAIAAVALRDSFMATGSTKEEAERDILSAINFALLSEEEMDNKLTELAAELKSVLQEGSDGKD